MKNFTECSKQCDTPVRDWHHDFLSYSTVSEELHEIVMELPA